MKTLLTSARIIGNKSTHNFNIIDTDNEPNLEDAIAVLETIDYILENMRIAKDKEEKLSKLEKKIKGEPVNNSIWQFFICIINFKINLNRNCLAKRTAWASDSEVIQLKLIKK